MPGIPLVARETVYARSTDQMCRQDSRARLSAEEEAAAEECLSCYCKPVELYNILQRRALKTPSFLQRCLSYKIFDKHRNRVQMTISVSTVNDGRQPLNVFPLCILLARPVPSHAVTKDCAMYHFSRLCMLTAHTGVDMNRQAKFVLPEINKLSEQVKCGSLAVLFISCAELIKDPTDWSSFSFDVGGQCFLGRIPMELLHLSWENSSTFSMGERTEFVSMVDMHSCLLLPRHSDEDKCVSFRFPNIAGDVRTFRQLQVSVTAEEVGAKWKTSYDFYNYIDVPLPLLSPIKLLRTGNVVFNYKYYRSDMQKTEVTEDFSCPFCLVKCASYKGLRLHLTASHDLFNFEFWVNADYQIVNVTVKNPWSPEAVGPDPKHEAVFYCSKPQRRRRPKRSVPNSRHVHQLVSDIPVSMNGFAEKTEGATDCIEHDTSSPNTTAISSATAQSFADPDCVQSLPGSNISSMPVLQFAKSRKLSLERSDTRNRALLQKRQFFHSHRAQPMALEQVFSDQDSEDEVDDDVADLEDRRMLDDFVDVTKDEKQMMHLWNSFVRKQRVLADSHIPWACEAFSRLHGREFVYTPALLRCWRLFMIKLWNHGLLDARSLNNCNLIFEQQQQDHDTDTTQC
ncbi:hypothetical protein Leryth_020198 [Lithospermum erythrorhizon]|nr:hypothetical protein Leryth_020198 [Lithospermum erythrorhizon]